MKKIIRLVISILIYGIAVYFEKENDKKSSKESILRATVFGVGAVLLFNFIIIKADGVFPSLNNKNEVSQSTTDKKAKKNISENREDTSNSENGIVKLCDLKSESFNDRFNKVEDKNIIDTIGNSYTSENLFELNTYGESSWGEYGYSEERRAFAVYDMGYKYKNVRGTIAVSDKTSNEKICARLEILGDNKLLQYYDLQRKTTPIEFEVENIENVNKLEFNLVFHSDDGYGDVYVLLSDVSLEENPTSNKRNESDNDNDNVQKLSNMKVVNRNERFKDISTHSKTDILGNIYSPDNLFELDTYGESVWGEHGYTEDRTAYGEFYINQQYQELNGIISVSDNTKDENVGGRFVIYDESYKEIYSQKMNRRSEPIYIEKLNVSGLKWIRFELQFYAEEGAGEFYILMSDFEFIK